jgi:hypothetical protein
MEDGQSQLTDDEFFESLLARYGLTREEGLERRWRFLTKRPTTSRIFHLLVQHDEMYQAEIARALGRTVSVVPSATAPLIRWGIVEVVNRGHHTYYKLRPGMVARYRQWLASQEPDELTT